MKVAVVGGGSVGLLLASFLAEQGVSVTVITKRQEQAESLYEKGLIRYNVDGSHTTVSVKATTDYSELSHQSLIVLAVKYTQLNDLLDKIVLLPNVPALLFLQNGLKHFQHALDLPYHTIAFGSVAFGAQKKDDWTVIHRGIGGVNVGVVRGDGRDVAWLITYSSELMPIQVVDDVEQMLFQKAFFNCLINPLTFIFQVKNGELLSNTQLYVILGKLYKEMVAVFPEAAQISFGQVEELCKKTSDNTSSMLSDRIHGRKTEIDTIAGAMLERAERLGKDLPILQSLYEQVRAYEGVDTQ